VRDAASTLFDVSWGLAMRTGPSGRHLYRPGCERVDEAMTVTYRRRAYRLDDEVALWQFVTALVMLDTLSRAS